MTKIKICGIKSVDYALAAMDAGADFLGFNFHPKSPRYIDVGICRNITSVMRKYAHVALIGVFVNASPAEVRGTIETCGLSLAQLHGDEPPEVLNELGGRAFKAFRGVPVDVNDFARSAPPALLLDASVRGAYGGTGVTADWDAAAELAVHYPLMLAGGLNPHNVAEAVEKVRPWAVDVASGVESAPGVKDAGKMQAFIAAVRRADGVE